MTPSIGGRRRAGGAARDRASPSGARRRSPSAASGPASSTPNRASRVESGSTAARVPPRITKSVERLDPGGREPGAVNDGRRHGGHHRRRFNGGIDPPDRDQPLDAEQLFEVGAEAAPSTGVDEQDLGEGRGGRCARRKCFPTKPGSACRPRPRSSPTRPTGRGTADGSSGGGCGRCPVGTAAEQPALQHRRLEARDAPAPCGRSSPSTPRARASAARSGNSAAR